MTKPVSIPNTFATQSGNVPASQLDANFSALQTAIDDIGTYANNGTDTGAANAYVVGFPAGVTLALASGIEISFNPANACTGAACSLNALGTGALPLTRLDGSNPAANDIAPGTLCRVYYSAASNSWILPTLPSSWAVTQAFHDVTASRAFNTSYTNNTKGTMFVSVSASASSSTPTSLIWNINSTGIQEGTVVAVSGYSIQITFAVPPAGTYVVSPTGGSVTLNKWTEVN